MKKLSLLALSVATFFSFSLHSPEGKMFPELTGEMLNGTSKTIPTDTKGKLTFVGMAFSSKSEDVLKTWYEPVYDKFVLKRGMFDKKYDVNLMFVPMYIGLKKAAYESTMNDLKKSNRKDLYPYILFYKGDLEPYGSALEMKDKALPYFFLLDENGKIVYTASGVYTEGKMEKLEEVMDGYIK
jgi:ATP10 protein